MLKQLTSSGAVPDDEAGEVAKQDVVGHTGERSTGHDGLPRGAVIAGTMAD
jgi:hypothetical protein